jgi:GT2 family glycosyltransferase
VNRVGVVIIGRNEGERLQRCLRSVSAESTPVVYVDSGSSDGSVALARGMGIEVLELDATAPFTAARARNAGLQHLLDRAPETEWVQFVDGDCELVDGWLELGQGELQRMPDVAVVCGRVREKHAGASAYHRIMAIELDVPPGDNADCAGVAMMRVEALRQVGGFNPALLAGEEAELCLRLRRQGWKTLRVDAKMARHQMQMYHWRQWWRRAVRTGYAYAAGAWLHGRGPERLWVHESLSIWFWGLWLPLLAWAGALATRGLSLLLHLGYPALALRIVRRMRRRGYSPRDGLAYALSCVLGKFPQLIGQMRFLRAQWSGQRGCVIEYK